MSKDIRQCPLYGGKYWADKEGHVYTADSKEVGVYDDGTGHLCTTTHPQVPVHRIVYYAFNPDAPAKGYCIHHINEDKTDNRLENLQLLTHGEHSRLHHIGKTNEKHPCSKSVLQYTKEGVFLAEYACVREAERATGVPHQNISLCCQYKRNTAGGYIWRFKNTDFYFKN